VVVFPESRLQAGVAEPVPDEVDVEAAVVAVVFVEEPVGEAVAEDVGVDVLWVAATELAVLVVPERLHVGLAGEPLDDVPDGAGRHSVGLARGEEVGSVLPAAVEVSVERPLGAERAVDVQLEMVGAGPVVATVPGLLLDVLREVQLAGVAEVHPRGELGQFLVAEAGVREERDNGLVPGPQVLGAGVGGGVSHRVDLLGGEPDTGLLVLSFRIC